MSEWGVYTCIFLFAKLAPVSDFTWQQDAPAMYSLYQKLSQKP